MDPVEALKAQLELLKPGAMQAAIVGSVNEALGEVVRLLEKVVGNPPPTFDHAAFAASLAQAMAQVQVTAPAIHIEAPEGPEAAAPQSWKTIQIQGTGWGPSGPTGYTLTKVD